MLKGLLGGLTERNPDTGLTPFQNFAASLDALQLPEFQRGDVIREAGLRRVAADSRNKTIEMLQKRAGGGDKIAQKYLEALQSRAISVDQAFSSYSQERAQQDRFNQQQAAALSKTRQNTAQTVAYLQSIGRNDLAAMVMANPSVGANLMASLAKNALGPDQQKINENTINARKEFTGNKVVKDFADVSFAFSRVVRSSEDPSGAGDLALIFNFMKVLDPGSVVREGEFATAQNAGGIDDRIRSLYNQVIEGTRLSEAQRADFVDRAARLYQGAEAQYDKVAEQYRAFATQMGLDPAQVIPDFSYAGQIPKTPTILQVPDTPTGMTPEEWKDMWQNDFTEQDRLEFLNG